MILKPEILISERRTTLVPRKNFSMQNNLCDTTVKLISLLLKKLSALNVSTKFYFIHVCQGYNYREITIYGHCLYYKFMQFCLDIAVLFKQHVYALVY